MLLIEIRQFMSLTGYQSQIIIGYPNSQALFYRLNGNFKLKFFKFNELNHIVNYIVMLGYDCYGLFIDESSVLRGISKPAIAFGITGNPPPLSC